MTRNLPFLFCLLASLTIHVPFIFALHHMHFSRAEIPIKSGNSSKDFTIHVRFSKPLPLLERPEQIEHSPRIKQLSFASTHNNIITKQEIKQNIPKVRQETIAPQLDKELIPETAQEEATNISISTLPSKPSKSNTGNENSSNTSNPYPIAKPVIKQSTSMLEHQTTLPQPDKELTPEILQEDVITHNNTSPYSQTFENTLPVEDGIKTNSRPVYLENLPPEYPRYARKLGYEGKTVFKVEVRADGRCGYVELIQSSGFSILDKAANEAVKKWRFKPEIQWGKPVSSFIEITINFQLE